MISAATHTARIDSLPMAAHSETTVRVRVEGVKGELYSYRPMQRGKNKGKLEVIVTGLHLGTPRDRSRTFFVEPDATCEVFITPTRIGRTAIEAARAGEPLYVHNDQVGWVLGDAAALARAERLVAEGAEHATYIYGA